MKKAALVLTAALILLTAGFIFAQSLPEPAVSDVRSEAVKEAVQPVVEPVLGEITNNFVRKTAHFIEFGVLGAELAVLVFLTGKRGYFVHAAFFAVLAALTDETIQIFTGRGPQVEDIWLDIAGAVCGMILVTAILTGLSLTRRNRKGGVTAML